MKTEQAAEDRMEKYCKYCEKAAPISDPDVMLCSRCGIVSAAHVCRRFRYDPLKRQPKRRTAEPELTYVDV